MQWVWENEPRRRYDIRWSRGSMHQTYISQSILCSPPTTQELVSWFSKSGSHQLQPPLTHSPSASALCSIGMHFLTAIRNFFLWTLLLSCSIQLLHAAPVGKGVKTRAPAKNLQGPKPKVPRPNPPKSQQKVEWKVGQIVSVNDPAVRHTSRLLGRFPGQALCSARLRETTQP